MASRQRYLIVDGHSIIFAWPDLRRLHARRTALARDELAKRLRHYQDWTGTHVAVVFDGRGQRTTSAADPHDIQIFYSSSGQTADAVVERLAGKYAKRHDIVVATSDNLVRETVNASGAEWISADALRQLIEERSR